ncbi:hypothetical protein V3A08_05655 [Tenacibaculum maritimum]|uniref:hypothetical protein n=1 Tax=Tenacibaculum maritimum TaxID=107401 RepID=UPI0012E5692A|nr:hypothetical protein [Tenacibaculum maritimum]CAA0220184.1 hypothetical protein DPIF89300162_450028 [Tenacibaculum maritimum]
MVWRLLGLFLQTYDTDYILEPISNKTLAKLLAGKLSSLEKLKDLNKKTMKLYDKNNKELLIKIIKDNITGEKYIIESIFINN